MSSNNNFKETFLTKKGEDVTIGEDSTDTMVINSNAEFNSQTTFNSQINMGGPIIPTTNSQFDIGSAEYKVRDLYLSSNSLHIGETILSEDTETDGQGNITERNIKIKTGDGEENEFKLAKLDAGGRLPNDKMPEGLLDGSGKINKTKIEATLSLNDLANVDTETVSPDNGQALVWNESDGGKWEPGTVGSTLTVQDEGSALDTAATTLNFVGQNVTATGTGATKTITISGGGGSTTLAGLTDVSDTSATNGQSLVYNSTTNIWEPETLVTKTIKYYTDIFSNIEPAYKSHMTVYEGSIQIDSDTVDDDRDDLIDNLLSGTETFLGSNKTSSNGYFTLKFAAGEKLIVSRALLWYRNGNTINGPRQIRIYGTDDPNPTLDNLTTIAPVTNITVQSKSSTSDTPNLDITFNSSNHLYYFFRFSGDSSRGDLLIGEFHLEGFITNSVGAGETFKVSDTTPQTGDSLVYSGVSNSWQPQRAASQFGLPAGDNAKLWVVVGESVSRVGNYPINHVGTGRTFNYDGDGHLYLNHSDGANYLEITDSNSFMDFSGASYTIAVVVDLSLYDGPSPEPFIADNNYSQTVLLQYNSNETHSLVFNNRNSPSHSGKFGIDYWLPTTDPEPFLHNPSPQIYEGKALLVVTYEYTSDGTNGQRVTIYKNGSQTISMQGDDYTTASTNTFWRFAGADSTQGGFQTSKFYAAAVWDRVLTTNEINQLTIDKLVSKRQTLPFYQISDNTPIDGQNLVYSSSTGQYEPKHASPTEIESQLCGGSLGTNDITTGWPRASTVYGNANGTTYPDRLFDNIVTHQYTEQAGWSSLFDASSTNNYAKVWNDSTEQYDSANSTHANGEDQLQMRFNQPRTITKIMMLWRGPYPNQFPKALRIFGSNTQPSAVSSYAGMNLLFQTDGTGYSQPQSTTYTGTAQDNLDIAIPFVIPEAKQGAYQYYTIQIDDLWNATGTHLTIAEMIFFHKTQNYRNFQYTQRTETHDFIIPGNNPDLQSSWVDITNGTTPFSLQITPLSNTSKIKLNAEINFDADEDSSSNYQNLGHKVQFSIKRQIGSGSATVINHGDINIGSFTLSGSGHNSTTLDPGHDIGSASLMYIDEPNTMQTITYTVVIAFPNTNVTCRFFWNRTYFSYDYWPDRSMSIFYAEEVMTGPPLTVNNVAISTTPMVGDSLVYDGSVWKSGFAELLQSLSRIGAGYGPPEGFINENPGDTLQQGPDGNLGVAGGSHFRGSAPPLGQSAVYVPTEYQAYCKINGATSVFFDNISNNLALNPTSYGGPSTTYPYVLEIAIDVPKVVTKYAMYRTSNSSLPYATAWEFQVYNSVNAEWVTLDTKTGQSITSSSTRPSEQTSGFVIEYVNTSILSRLYRFSITESSGTGVYDYIQFGELSMEFKQPTSVTKVNVEGTPTAGDFIKYDGNGSQWVPGSVALDDLTNVSSDQIVDVPFLGGIPTNKVSIISQDFSHDSVETADGSATYVYSNPALYDNRLYNTQTTNGSYYVTGSWDDVTPRPTWWWKFTISQSKIVKYVRIWPFYLNYPSGKTWNLYGSNDGGSNFTLLGTHVIDITDYPEQPGFSTTVDIPAYRNEHLSVRIGFEDNNTAYTTYKLEITTYNSGDYRFGLREIQFGEQSSVGPLEGQALVYNSSNQWVLSNPVAFRVYKNDPDTVPYSNYQDIDFDCVLFDTHNGWSKTDYDYTVSISGIYQVGFHGGTPDVADSGAKVRIMHYDGFSWNIAAEFGSDAGMANSGITLIQASMNDKFKITVREAITFNVHNTTLLSMFGHRIM